MIKDSRYQTYAATRATDVPMEHLQYLINVMVEDAALNMGSIYNKKVVDRLIEFAQSNEFNYLPLCVIASAFAQGSLGKYGAGRLVPRTVHAWLKETAEEYNRERDHKAREESYREKPVSFDLHKYPVGQAISKKIDWLKSGTIHESDWEKIPLKELSERIASGMNAVPELFGIQSKNRNR